MRLFLGIMLIILAGAGNAFAELGAVSTDLAEIRSAPSASQSFVALLAPRYYPLFIIESRGNFYKVSDYLNNIGWIEKGNIDRTKTVIVNAKSTGILSTPGADNSLLFTAQAGVTFKVIGEEGGWLKVEHENGMVGWLSRSQVWGDF